MKKWLENNKVFFEIFSYTFLGIASIVVGLMTWKLGQRELELSEIDREPVINVQVDRNSLRKPITVFNDGYHLFEPMIFVTSVFQVEQHLPNHMNKYYHFEVEDYYVEKPENGNTRGEIVINPLHEESVGQIDRIRKELNEIGQREKTRLDLNQIVFVSTSYKDINQNYIDRLFVVDDYLWETSSSYYNLILGKVEEKIEASDITSYSGDKIFKRLSEKENLSYPFTVKVDSLE